jgi:hypothetical protein
MKISKSEQAQIDYDADIARKLTENETAKKKRQDELEIASFMEAKSLNKLETTASNPVSIFHLQFSSVYICAN